MKAMEKRFKYKYFNSFYIHRLLLVIAISLIINPLFSRNRETRGLETVVIDAGHGGKDPGAVVGKAHEKDIVLQIALKLGNYIKEKLPDVKVIYTRRTDVFVPLFERSVIANKNNADLFISIHANFCSSPSVKGTETYVLGLHRTEDNLNVAKKENSVILLEKDYTTRYEGFNPNLSESYIMFELIQNTHLDQSVIFAGILQDSFQKHAQRASRDVRQAGFLVLRETAMPGVLIETGYLSNQSESSYLMTDTGRDALALSIFNSFKSYKEKFESRLNLASRGESKKESREVSNNVPSEQQSPEINNEIPTPQYEGRGKKNQTEINNETPTPQHEARGKKNQPVINNEIPTPHEARGKKNQPVINNEVNRRVNEPVRITFAVQLSASPVKLSLNSKRFNGIENISEIFIGGYYKYYCLETGSFLKAKQNLSAIRMKIPDAFITAFKNGEPIPMKEALHSK